MRRLDGRLRTPPPSTEPVRGKVRGVAPPKRIGDIGATHGASVTTPRSPQRMGSSQFESVT